MTWAPRNAADLPPELEAVRQEKKKTPRQPGFRVNPKAGNPPKEGAKRPRIRLDCVNLDDKPAAVDPDKPNRLYRQCEAGHGRTFEGSKGTWLCGCDPAAWCPGNCGDYQRETV